MLLYCPQCNTGYALEKNLISEKGMKMRCAKCGKIWFCTRDDLKEEPLQDNITNDLSEEAEEKNEVKEASSENTNNEENSSEEVVAQQDLEMQDIFERLSVQTKDLFQKEQNSPIYQKIWKNIKQFLGLNRHGILKYYLFFILLIAALCLVSARYEIVRIFPKAEPVYAALGFESKVIGEGLEFQNIVRNEYEEDYVRKLEIKGYIVNTNPNKIDMPLIHVEIMDKDTNILQAIDDEAPITELNPNEKQLFRIVVTQPSALAKYVLLTFKKKNN